MSVLIPILLVIIIVVLLFGAAAIKSSIVRNFQLLVACGLFAWLWTTIGSVPAAFWWSVGALVPVGIGAVLVYWWNDKRVGDIQFRETWTEGGLSREDADHYLKLCAANRREEAAAFHMDLLTQRSDAETKSRMIESGMSEANADKYVALIHSGHMEEASALHLEAMTRENERFIRAARPA